MNLETTDLLSLAARSTAPLVAGGLALVALRRASAAARHVVALGSLAASILAPAASLLLPGLAIPLLPAREVAAPASVIGTAPATPVAPPTSLPMPSAAPAPARWERSKVEAAGASAPGAPEPAAPSAGLDVAQSRAGAPVATVWAPASQPAARAVSPALIAAAAWVASASVLLLRLAAGYVRASYLAREATPASSAFGAAALEAARRLDLRSAPEVRLSSSVSTPVVVGLRKPVVVFPEEARGWSAERVEAVLLHELAHVGRGDLLARLVANAAVAVAPWNPLAWALRRAAERAAERAADDAVLVAGARASDYADVLVSLVRERQAGTPRLALALGRPSDLASRVERVLDAATPRGLSAAGRRAAAVTLGLVGVSAAILTPVRVEAVPAASTAVVEGVGLSVAPLRMTEMLDAVPALSRPAGVLPAHARPALARQVFAPRDGGPAVVLASGRGERSGSDWYDRGMELHHDERYADAIAAFAKSIGEGHREGASAYNIACGYALLGKSEEAFSWLKRAASYGFDVASYLSSDDDLDSLRSDPRFAALRTEVKDLKSEAEKAEGRRAIARWERLKANAGATGGAVEDAAKSLYDAEEWTAAAAAYEDAARRGDRPGTMLYNAACSWALAGKSKEALDALDRSVDQGWIDASHMRQDDDLVSVRSDARFGEIARRAKRLELPPNWNSGFFSRLVGIGGRKGGKSGLREAAERYQAYLKERPQSPVAWTNLGLVRLRLEEWNEARSALEKALALGYRKPTTLYNLACVEAGAGNTDRAFERLNASLDAGFSSRWTLSHDEDLDSIRSDRRFRDVLRKVRKAERDED